MQAGYQWRSGRSAFDIATQRPRPITVSTALGYVADCLAVGLVGDPERLTKEAGIDRGVAMKVAAALKIHALNGIVEVKRYIDSQFEGSSSSSNEDIVVITYSHIKVVAALMASGSLQEVYPQERIL